MVKMRLNCPLYPFHVFSTLFFPDNADYAMNGPAVHYRGSGSGPETWRCSTQEGEWSSRTGRKT